MSQPARRAPARASAFLLLLTLTSPAIGAAAGRGETVSAEAALASIDIDNFGRINAKYYRGAEPDAGDYGDLAALGIRTFVDLRSDDVDPAERTFVETAGMNYFQLPMNTRVAPTAAEVQSFLQIVNDPANQPVFVHCVGGKHRTGVMTAIYRMTQDGWSGEQAFREMKQYKFGLDFLHPEFKDFVLRFDDSVLKTARLDQ